jgi:hypothetical protein
VEKGLEIESEKMIPSLKQYLARYPTPKRIKIESTLESTDKEHLKIGNFCYNGFVKREAMMTITKGNFTPLRPRLIQGCSQYSKGYLGVWFLSYSNAMKLEWHYRNHIYYASGRTTNEINEWFEFQRERLGFDIIYSCSDFSKFDLTQGVDCIKAENDWYRQLGICQQKYGELQLRAKMNTTLYAGPYMVEYLAKRKSGDNDTSSGNTRNTAMLIVTYLKSVGFTRNDYSLGVLGDDCFMLFNANRFLRIKTISKFNAELLSWADNAGYSLKLITTTKLMEVEFLSSKFYSTNEGYKFGKKPGRGLSKLGTFLHKYGADENDYLSYLKGTLISYKPTGNHVPFLRVFIQEVLKRLEGLTPKFDYVDDYILKGDTFETDTTTWVDFENYYGLGEEQEEIFKQDFIELLDQYGLNFVMDSEMVDTIFELDFQL